MIRNSAACRKLMNVPELKSNIDFGITRDNPHTEGFAELSTLYTAVNGVADGLWRITMDRVKMCVTLE